MVTSKIAKEPNILFVPKTRRRKRKLLRVILFIIGIAGLVIFFVILASDRSVPYSFF